VVSTPENAIRIVLVEDHALVRAGLLRLVQEIPGVEIVGEAGDGHRALLLVENLQPDIVLMDISIPGVDGLECCARIVRSHPHIKVLILSMHNTPGFVSKALRCGAAGYLVKDAAEAELQIAIQALSRGERFLSPGIAHHVLEGYLKHEAAPISPLDKLTTRQREVLLMIAQGHNTKQIASRLKLSTKTVETHRAMLMERLGIHDIAGLTRIAMESGLLDLEPVGQATGAMSF
jgi:DNA-binding NarL/FixJ family response regulator